MLTSREIRQSFLDFFRGKEHQVVPSSPVVLPADPSLLFTNAGMNQFKEIFLGVRESRNKRVANTQKCIRVSGKHNDLEEVGYDTYHHTFFEMLGNWSFGDYYKREAISWAWELLAEVWKLPKSRLWATVYREDDEAMHLWRELTDIPADHVLKFDAKDNFWEMGETGPCGPCSEIHIDLTENGCGPEMVNAGSPEVIELWNLVFIQYNRRADKSLEELPSKHVDTGMGFERLCAVLQQKKSNYDSDVFAPLLNKLRELSSRPYEGDDAVAMRVIADHVRTLSIAIADGVLPSNDGRGYVLRRILRRATRYARNLGMTEPFMAGLVPVLEEQMGDVFPEIGQRREEIMRAITSEERSFIVTIDRGMGLFEQCLTELRDMGENVFPGATAFRLYDECGFPVDLTELMCRENQCTLDRDEYDHLLQEKIEGDRARAGGKNQDTDLIADLVNEGISSEFTGYDRLTDAVDILTLFDENGRCEELTEGQTGRVILDRTPFYGEAGGQMGDEGILCSPDGTFMVENTIKPAMGIMIHVGHMVTGRFAAGDRVEAEVNKERRRALARHHTGTHLLNYALRKLVSMNIKQAGSYVAPDRLRFDFSHFESVPQEKLDEVEQFINRLILENIPVNTFEMAYADVHNSDIVAVFDEKYGDTVRVVKVGDYSKELCGGTHAHETGDLGLFRILSESSVAAGIRRIEAVCGLPAYERTWTEHDLVRTLSHLFSAAPEEIVSRVKALMDQNRKLEKELARSTAQAARNQAGDLMSKVRNVAGIKLLAEVIEDQPMNGLLKVMDGLRDKMASGVILLGSASSGKASFVASASKDCVERGIHAGKLIGKIAAIAGGGGGGQPHKAQAGAKNGKKVPEAVALTEKEVEAMLQT